MSEQELLYYIRTDTSLGLQKAIEEYGGAVKTICRSILAGYSDEDVEEAVSDTFVGLWRASERIELVDGSGLKGYLYGIARRTALNKKRKLAKQQTMEDIDTVVEAADTDVEQEAVRNAEYQILYQMVLDMTSPDKEIFLYRYFRDYTVKEIATNLAITAKTVENRLRRGRARLKRQLLQVGIDVD